MSSPTEREVRIAEGVAKLIWEHQSAILEKAGHDLRRRDDDHLVCGHLGCDLLVSVKDLLRCPLPENQRLCGAPA